MRAYSDAVYDPLSRLRSVTSTTDGLTSYSYDQRSQLTGVDNAWYPDESFGYDEAGNRSEAAGYVTLDDNRTVSGPGGTTYTYDHEGNVTNSYDGQYHWTYTWDHRNRLVEASRSGLTIDYEYDAFNRLIRMNNSQTNNNAHFVYDEGINPIMEYSSSSTGDPRKYYLWSDAVDDLLATQQLGSGGTPGNVLWPLADHLGSIRDIADRNDTTGVTSVTNHRRYDSFGNLKSETNAAVDLNFGYTGKLFDEATGLQNNLNRWYNPRLGKFISQDPIGINSGDANPYRYVGNRATGYVDPLGLADEVGGLQTVAVPEVGPDGSVTVRWPGGDRPYATNRPDYGSIGACDPRPMTAERSKQYAIAEMEYQVRQAQQHGRSTALLQADLMKMRLRPAAPAPLLVAWGPQDAGYGVAWDVLAMAGGVAKGSNPYNVAAGIRQPIRVRVPSNIQVATAPLNPGIPTLTLVNSTRGWRVGNPINNLTAAGNVPTWSAVRQRWWKNESHFNPEGYSQSNVSRMRLGLAPQRINPRTGKLESMELHHTPPQCEGGLFDVRPLWPEAHALIDPFRHTGR